MTDLSKSVANGDLIRPQDAAADALRLAGAIQAFRATRALIDVQTALVLKQVHDSKSYEPLGYSWKRYCTELCGLPYASVAEALQNLEELGEEFMRAAERLGLGRSALRGLRRLPADARPRVLPSGEIEIGDERVSIEDRDSVIDLIEQLVGSREQMQRQIEEGVKQLADLSQRVEELEGRPKYESTASENPEVEGRLMTVCRLLSQVWQLLQDEEPTEPLQALVMHYVRVIDVQYLRELTAFGTGWRPSEEVPEGLDPEAYRELEEEERREARAQRRARR